MSIINQAIEDQVYDEINFSASEIPGRQFVNCTFNKCIFSSSDLSNKEFLDCIFNACDLSLVNLSNTGMKSVQFKNSKLMGIDFSRCSDFLFAVEFEKCLLDFTIFTEKKLKKTRFMNCSLKEADFTAVDLSYAVFDECDLNLATFVQCNLEHADFRSAFNYAIDPDQNKLRKAKFCYPAVLGLLAKYNVIVE